MWDTWQSHCRVMECGEGPSTWENALPRGEVASAEGLHEEAWLRLQGSRGGPWGLGTHSPGSRSAHSRQAGGPPLQRLPWWSGALKLLSEHRFLGRCRLPGPEDSRTPKQSPGHGHGALRSMDIDDVARTDKIKDRWGSLWGEADGVLGTMPPIRDLGRWGPNP